MNSAIVDIADALIIVLTEYDNSTERLFQLDLAGDVTEDVIADIDSMLLEREGIRHKVEAAHSAFVDAIGSIEIDYNTELGEKVREMLSLQLEIMKKDKDFNTRFTQKYGEVKTALRDSQEDKKRLDYFHTTSGIKRDTGFKV